MRYPEGGDNEGRKMISRLRNKIILRQYLGGYKIQRVSILNIGTRANKRRMSDKFQEISQIVFRK